jgi:hypothetical protein
MSEYILLFPKSVNNPQSIFVDENMELITKEKTKSCELENAADILKTLGLQRATTYTIDKKKNKHELPMPATKLGIILGSWGKIHCIQIPVINFNETEGWHSWADVKDKTNPLMRTIIMLMKNRFENWSIYAEDLTSNTICMHWNN